MTDLTSTDLALLAERSIWRVLISADREFAGMPPSTVRDLAGARLQFVEGMLCHIVADHADLLDYGITDRQKARAFGEAAINMHETLQLISSVLETA